MVSHRKRTSDRGRLARRGPAARGLWKHERELHALGYRLIAGVDEAGRGTLAGPVVAAAVILPERVRLRGLADSKRISSPARRAALAAAICDQAVAVGVGVVGVRAIERLNIYHSTCEAMRRAVATLSVPADMLLVDGRPVPGFPVPQRAVVKGDARCGCIAAASIVAKVARDRLMDQLAEEFPAYGFRRHRGYATPEHLQKLAELGVCRAHRRSFGPVMRRLQGVLGLEARQHAADVHRVIHSCGNADKGVANLSADVEQEGQRACRKRS